MDIGPKFKDRRLRSYNEGADKPRGSLGLIRIKKILLRANTIHSS